ncbi:MAG: tyrosine-type recombinase/integrase [Phycisphaerae bacterium]|nr:tyrosine-type recombinase/integrase [Phycisphaerae bacterium]
MKSHSWELDPKKFLSRQDANSLLAVAGEQAEHGNAVAFRDSFIIHLGLATGLRVMEMAALNCGDLSLEDTIPSLVVTSGKGKKRRRVFFNDNFKKQCKEYLVRKQVSGESTESEHPLLLSSSTGGHLTTRAIQKAFKRCAKKAGLPSRYSIHCLRHTYACFLLKASNWNLRLVQKQLGHSKITTTQIYADVMMPEIKKALDRLYI